MFRADSFPSFGHSPISPYNFVAITVFSLRPPPGANQVPMICSVRPRFSPQPYTLAVSKKFMPCSRAASMMAWESASSVCGPKFIVPRHSRLTFKPVRPRYVYSIVDSHSQV